MIRKQDIIEMANASFRQKSLHNIPAIDPDPTKDVKTHAILDAIVEAVNHEIGNVKQIIALQRCNHKDER